VPASRPARAAGRARRRRRSLADCEHGGLSPDETARRLHRPRCRRGRQGGLRAATAATQPYSNSLSPAALNITSVHWKPWDWSGVVAASTTAPPRPCGRRGRIPRRAYVRTVIVPLCSRTNASPFWIILLLVLARSENGSAAASWKFIDGGVDIASFHEVRALFRSEDLQFKVATWVSLPRAGANEDAQVRDLRCSAAGRRCPIRCRGLCPKYRPLDHRHSMPSARTEVAVAEVGHTLDAPRCLSVNIA
jgi:hypothetical protein